MAAAALVDIDEVLPLMAIAQVQIAEPRIVLSDVRVNLLTRIAHWSLSRDDALELRELLDEGIREYDALIDRRGRPE